MIRLQLLMDALSGTSSGMLVDASLFAASLFDWAIKGTAMLALAGLVAGCLRRDSAATRHLVWLLAVIALLGLPLFSALLPAWRVFPAVGLLLGPPSVAPPSSAAAIAINAEPVSQPAVDAAAQQARKQVPKQAMETLPATIPAAVAPADAVTRAKSVTATVEPTSGPLQRLAWLSRWWAAGCLLLLLRLMLAHWMLWRRGRRGQVIASSIRRPTDDRAESCSDPMVQTFQAACDQLNVRSKVRLLIDSQPTIPVVWGTVRPCLQLPAEARQWSRAQLRSVMLHELAHIRRRDTLCQWLVQIACALHWFNPLVWFAAWRLHVEREQACDDLVLVSGVRASTYARHLLDLATRLSATSWAQVCGLAMARRSSLEHRLGAVLSDRTNRRGVTRVVRGAALLVAAAMTIPLAMLHAADDPPANAASDQKGDPVSKPAAASKVEMKPQHLKPNTIDAAAERKLAWGESVNGLRAAVSTSISLEKPDRGVTHRFGLVVQNVSDAAIRLIANADTPNPRWLRVRKDGQTLLGLRSDSPSNIDYRLQPQEIAVLPLFPSQRDEVASLAKDPALTFYAVMQIEQAPAGGWTGKLTTAEWVNDETEAAGAADAPQPNAESAQALWKKWQQNARQSGMIPGGAIGSLAQATANFVKLNPSDKRAEPLAELLKRMDTSRDWSPAEVVALLDEVTSVYESLPSWTLELDRFGLAESVGVGAPLPQALSDAPWGPAQPGGLRTAWLLDPSGEQHRLGTPLKSRILFHNAGKTTVVFRALSWNQSAQHKAVNQQGTAVPIRSTRWTTIPQVFVCRLGPNQYAEVTGAGIGVGANQDVEDWRGTRVGAWIDANEGDEVTFLPAPVSVDGNDQGRIVGEPAWWLSFITARLQRDAPVPNDADERRRLIDRAVRDLFGGPPTAQEIAAFVADQRPDALDQLANRLARRDGITPFSGTVKSAESKFRVLPVDPLAATKPRIAVGPGRYTLADSIRLIIVRKSEAKRIVNEASIAFFPSPANDAQPAKPYPLELPDGYNTWSIAWQRGSTVLWVAEKGVLRRCDFGNPAEVQQSRFDAGNFHEAPESIRDALRTVFETGSSRPRQDQP